MPRTALGAAVLTTGELIVVSTVMPNHAQSALNRIHAFTGSHWTTVAEWRGVELAAFCTVGNTVVCAADRRRLYLVRDGVVTAREHPDGDRFICSAFACGTVAVFGGSRGYFLEYDVALDELTVHNLRQYHVEAPGRNINAIIASDPGLLLVGENRLLLRISQETAVSLLAPGPSNDITGFHAAAYLGDSLFVTGRTGAYPFLAAVEASVLKPISVPPGILGSVTPLVCWRSSLLLGAHFLSVLTPSHPAIVHEFLNPEASTVALTPFEDGILALAWNGEVFHLSSAPRRLPPVFKRGAA